MAFSSGGFPSFRPQADPNALARPASARPTISRPPRAKRPKSAVERLCHDMEMRIAKREEMKEREQLEKLQKEVSRQPVRQAASEFSEIDPDDVIAPSEMTAPSDM